MARPTKIGLDYFPFETSLPDDDKIKLVRARFGLKGYAVYTLLLCKIYRDKGYYCNWGEDEALLFATEVGDGVNIALVNDLVQELFKRDLLNRGIFERFKILTSKGIQERFSLICKQSKRTVEIRHEFDCRALEMLKRELTPEKRELTPEKHPIIPAESTQRKGKESKEKEMKGKCVDNPIWMEQTCMLLKTKPHTLSKFCNDWIDKAGIAMKFEQYSINSLIGFMIKDFEKNHPREVVARESSLTENDRYLEFENRQKMQQHGKR